jgi:hypothetical protein
MGSSIARKFGFLGLAQAGPILIPLSLIFLAACAPSDLDRSAIGNDSLGRSVEPTSLASATIQDGAEIPDGKMASLIGIAASELEAQLGPPARIRVETPIKVYQYVGAECVLDLYLYAAKADYRVFYAEARDTEAQSLSVDRCLQSIGAADIASIGS